MFAESLTYENPFLSVEKKFIEVLSEKQGELTEEADGNNEDFEAKLYQSFVKEKPQLIGYISELVNFAAL